MNAKHSPPLSAQVELFKADTTWFHVFHDLVKSKAWAAMTAPEKIVYITAKAFVNWKTGAAFPSLETLAEYSGLSRAAIHKALKGLEERKYIRTEKTPGKKTLYTMLERVPITGKDGRPAAVATFDYLPGAVREAVAELKNVMVSGDLADGKYIHIETLNLTVNVAGNAINSGPGNQTIVQTDDGTVARACLQAWHRRQAGELTVEEYEEEMARIEAGPAGGSTT